jgi:hypothetical protein
LSEDELGPSQLRPVEDKIDGGAATSAEQDLRLVDEPGAVIPCGAL